MTRRSRRRRRCLRRVVRRRKESLTYHQYRLQTWDQSKSVLSTFFWGAMRDARLDRGRCNPRCGDSADFPAVRDFPLLLPPRSIVSLISFLDSSFLPPDLAINMPHRSPSSSRSNDSEKFSSVAPSSPPQPSSPDDGGYTSTRVLSVHSELQHHQRASQVPVPSTSPFLPRPILTSNPLGFCSSSHLDSLHLPLQPHPLHHHQGRRDVLHHAPPGFVPSPPSSPIL